MAALCKFKVKLKAAGVKTQQFESQEVKKKKCCIQFIFFLMFEGLKMFFLCVFRVQQWAVSFGKEIAALSARYSGAKLLQKVRDHAWMQKALR